MKAYVQVAAGESRESHSCVLLWTETAKMMFNVGDGTQRIAVEHKLKLAKITHMYFTRVEADTIGGLPGMLMTVSDQGNKKIALGGPRNLSRYLNATRWFLYRPDMQLDVEEASGGFVSMQNSYEALWTEAKFCPRVEAFSLAPGVEGVMDGVTHRSQVIPAVGVENGFVEEDDQGEIPGLQPLDGGTVLTYAVTLPQVPGKFNAKRALELGVAKGPQFGALSRGESVETSDGRTVTPEDVVEPATPGPVVLIVDVPDETYLGSLFSCGLLERFGHRATIVIHFSPESIVNGSAYQGWLSGFSAAKHVYTHRGAVPPMGLFRASAVQQGRLSALDQSVWTPVQVTDDDWSEGGVTRGRPLMKYHLVPLRSQGWDYSETLPPLLNGGLVAEAELKKELHEARELLQKAIDSGSELELEEGGTLSVSQMEWLVNETTDEKSRWGAVARSDPDAGTDERWNVDVVTLGTGSALPSKYRNTTAIYVRFVETGFGMLLDAGEGTYSQLLLKYGEAQMSHVIAGLRVIVVSHMHADHHDGVIELLEARERVAAAAGGMDAIGGRTLVISPNWFGSFLKEYGVMRPLSIDWAYIGGVENHASDPCSVLRSVYGLSKLSGVVVDHCPDAWGIVLESVSGWKLVFSGDTRPVQSLIDAGQGATLLLHEATLADELIEDAKEKKHTTTGEAINVAIAMNAKRVLLTHFSQRYPQVPAYKHELTERIALATDFMTVNLRHLEALPELLPLQALALMSKSLGLGEGGSKANSNVEPSSQKKKKRKRLDE